jgi:hypothetical protein
VKFSVSILVLVIAGFCACVEARGTNPVPAGSLDVAEDSTGIKSIRLSPAGTDTTALAWELVKFDQIKVFTDSVKAFKGSLVSMTWSALIINNGWSSIPVERSAAHSIELYRRDAKSGVSRGALLGTAFGLVICTAINVGNGFSQMKMMGYGESEHEQKLVAVWSVPACALIGSILGYSHHKKVATLTPDEFWERYQR